MKSRHPFLLLVGCAILLFAAVPQRSFAANAQVLGWNNLGMHCMDSDYSVFSILPPYNTINAQLIVNGVLVTASNGYSVTYEAVADPAGSINKTSAGKGNWLQYTPLLYGAVAADQGLPFPGPDSFWMPGTNNTPQGMLFDASVDWFYAYGIPITPYDDTGKKNPYPMMRIVARNGGAAVIATNEIVLPVSDEMDCRACHASGTQAAAQPAAGWVWSDKPERDFRLNILRLHDEKNFAAHHDVYVTALASNKFNPQGLYRGVVADGQPVLCAVCHASEALATHSFSNIPPLTASIHAKHATVLDPELNLTLDHSDHRAACYRCHPGSATKCLRGAMGGAITADGTMSMQCQSCHGNMSQVGKANRTGWLEEPNCQQCHTGTAMSNNGQIRYNSCFTDTNWTLRVVVNQTFATKSNTPAPGISLYRFSAGHGGLQCSACHGSTHAEFPATHRNDNVRNEKIQGHAGVMVECTACHVTMSASSSTYTNGPHGLHPIGQNWVRDHHDVIGEDETEQCRACHGLDYRGTPLSRMQSTNLITVNRDGTVINFPTYKGAEVGCYNCHNGPTQSSANTSANPVASNLSTNTLNHQVLTFTLPVSTNATARIIAQPTHGAVGVSSNVATYFPEAGFIGTDTFTFAAWDGSKNSTLATGTVAVAQGPFGLTSKTLVPANYPATWAAPFTVLPSLSNIVGSVTFDWDFGDASPHSTNQYATHAYASAGNYPWAVVSRLLTNGVSARTTTNSGIIAVGPPMKLTANAVGASVVLSWLQTSADALLEKSAVVGVGAGWTVCTNVVTSGGGSFSVTVPGTGMQFYRLRKL